MVQNLRRSLTELSAVVMLAIVMIVAALALTGPSVGNVFSNISMNLPPSGSYSSDPNNLNSNRHELILTNNTVQNRVLLRDATLHIMVEDTEMTISAIDQMTVDMGGWVVSANTSSYTNANEQRTTNGRIAVRIPAERLDDALLTIRESALEVTSEVIEGSDVTEEYIDLDGRLRTLQTTEDQLVTILESAATVEDVLAVQVELGNVRGQIEETEGRLRFFDEAAAYSAITVHVVERVPSVGSVEVAGWNPFRTAENALGSLIVVGQFLADSAIVLVIVGVPLLFVGWFIVAVIRRARQLVRGA